jgi:hypothetical protein
MVIFPKVKHLTYEMKIANEGLK